MADGAWRVEIVELCYGSAGSGPCPNGQNSQSNQPHAPDIRRGFYLAFLIGRTKSTLHYFFFDFSKQAALLISLLRLRAAFAISTVATCILQAGSMRSFAFGTGPSHALHQVRQQGCPSSLALSSRWMEAGKR
jgi:hypothetical protein